MNYVILVKSERMLRPVGVDGVIRVKPFVRTRKGKMERVGEFSRPGGRKKKEWTPPHKSPENAKEVFENEFPVIKDLQSIRQKDVYQEDIAEAIEIEFGLNARMGVPKRGPSESYMQQISEGVTVTPDKSIGIYHFAMRMGIPTYKVGVKDPEKWKEITDYLRVKKLLRTPETKKPSKEDEYGWSVTRKHR